MVGNLVKWIEKEADGEEVEAVVIAEMDWVEYGPDTVCPWGRILDWEEAKKYIDFDFGYDEAVHGCEPIYAWTKTWVIFLHEYDGNLSLCRMPRNPMSGTPTTNGEWLEYRQ